MPSAVTPLQRSWGRTCAVILWLLPAFGVACGGVLTASGIVEDAPLLEMYGRIGLLKMYGRIGLLKMYGKDGFEDVRLVVARCAGVSGWKLGVEQIVWSAAWELHWQSSWGDVPWPNFLTSLRESRRQTSVFSRCVVTLCRRTPWPPIPSRWA